MKMCEVREEVEDDGRIRTEYVCRWTGVSCRLTCEHGQCEWDNPPRREKDETIGCKTCGIKCKRDAPGGLCSFCQATTRAREEVAMLEEAKDAVLVHEGGRAACLHRNEGR